MVSGNFYTSTTENALVGSEEVDNFDDRLINNAALHELISQETD